MPVVRRAVRNLSAEPPDVLVASRRPHRFGDSPPRCKGFAASVVLHLELDALNEAFDRGAELLVEHEREAGEVAEGVSSPVA